MIKNPSNRCDFVRTIATVTAGASVKTDRPIKVEFGEGIKAAKA
jgi:hypothetical protein